MIKIKNISKKYGDKTVLNNISFDVDKGVCLGLLGHNGAGKTTLIGIISTLIRPDKGTILIGGKDIKEKPDTVKEALGVSVQESSFEGNKKVGDVLIFMCKLKGLNSEEAKKETKRLIREFRIHPFIDKKIKELSHGMMKIVNVAQAFINNPKIIILDEPLSGLDISMRRVVREAIKNQKKKSTIIISSHLIEEIEILCTDVAILHKGKHKVKEKVRSLKHANPHFIYTIISDKETIKRLKKDRQILGVESKEGEFIIHSKKDIYPKLKKFCSKNKCKITSMRAGKSIEDIFFEIVN